MRAMVLAAGLGTRMRPLTNTCPKPLLPVGGRCMLDRALDKLDEVGAESVVVNYHYLGKMVIDHVKDRNVLLSDETEQLLETGGGVVKALPLLGAAPFYVINSDIMWQDGPTPALQRLLEVWNPDEMDALLLVHPCETAVGFDGAGDFFCEEQKLTRRGEAKTAPYVFAGVQILHPDLFEGEPVEPFSLNRIYDKALAKGRLAGVIHDGAWYHVGTPETLKLTESLL